MVMSASEFIRTSHLFADDFAAPHDDLSFPSPPKALDGLRHKRNVSRIQVDEAAAKGSSGVRRSSSVMNRVSRASSLLKNSLLDVALGCSPIEPSTESPPDQEGVSPQRSPVITETPPTKNRHSGFFDTLPVLREACKETFPVAMPVTPSRLSHPNTDTQRIPASPTRHTSMPLHSSRESKALSPLQLFTSAHRSSLSLSCLGSKDTQRSISMHCRNPSSPYKASSESARPLLLRNTSSSRKAKTDKMSPRARVNVPTPFFEPSELEDIMAPFRQKFAEEQADLMKQAKAAYEQLNQQLSDELPQLIDLRYGEIKPVSKVADPLTFVIAYHTSIHHSKPSSKFNYASARKLTAAWPKYSSISMPRHATSMPAAISMHEWRMC